VLRAGQPMCNGFYYSVAFCHIGEEADFLLRRGLRNCDHT
jgi:hypothetical protein